jgi:hypothetical protein
MHFPARWRWLLVSLSLALLLAGCPGSISTPSGPTPPPSGSTPPPSDRVRVDAELKYQDSNGDRPIIGSRVEVWRFAPRTAGIWAWGNDGFGNTDDHGRFTRDFDFIDRGVKYALRVFPWNSAAQCCFGNPPNGGDSLYVEPGQVTWPVPTGTPIQKSAHHPGETLPWNYTWPTGWWAEAFNIVETLRHGRAFSERLRNPEESKRQPMHTAHIARDGCAHHSTISCTYPVSGDIFIAPGDGQDDYAILHEYGHYLQYDIGSLAWIASSHSGCVPGSAVIIGGGALPPDWRSKHAWLEGFADWFALVMHDKYGAPANLDGGYYYSAAGAGESSTCSSTDPGDMLERHVANMLWDLSDPANPSESQDRAQDQQQLIIQLMDQELGTPTTRDWPTTFSLYTAARHRYFNGRIAPESILRDIYTLNRLRVP